MALQIRPAYSFPFHCIAHGHASTRKAPSKFLPGIAFPQGRSIRRLLLLLWGELQEFALLRLLSSGLADTSLLVVTLARLDSRCACNGLGTKIWTVALLGGGVDNAGVELARRCGSREGGSLVLGSWLVAARGQLGSQEDSVVVCVDTDGLCHIQ